MRLGLGHAPEAPLIRAGAVAEVGRPKRSLPILLGQVEIDGHRLPQDCAIVIDHRDVSVGVESQMLWLARATIGNAHRYVLEFESEFLGRPQRAAGAGHRRAIDFKHRKNTSIVGCELKPYISSAQVGGWLGLFFLRTRPGPNRGDAYGVLEG